jgi:hypothetical protein
MGVVYKALDTKLDRHVAWMGRIRQVRSNRCF